MRPPRLAGKWLLTAHRAGHGNYVGEVVITAGAAEDEFTTRIKLQPVSGGPAIERTGRVLVYAGYSWRGRSMGTAPSSAPGDVPSEMYETMWISPDEPVATGRWFWGGYDEFSFEVKFAARFRHADVERRRSSIPSGWFANTTHTTLG